MSGSFGGVLTHLFAAAALAAATATMKAEFAAATADTKADFAAATAAMKTEIVAATASMRADLAATTAALKAELKADIAIIHVRLDRCVEKSDLDVQKVEMLKWFIGASGVQTVAIIAAVIAVARSFH